MWREKTIPMKSWTCAIYRALNLKLPISNIELIMILDFCIKTNQIKLYVIESWVMLLKFQKYYWSLKSKVMYNFSIKLFNAKICTTYVGSSPLLTWASILKPEMGAAGGGSKEDFPNLLEALVDPSMEEVTAPPNVHCWYVHYFFGWGDDI